MPFSLAFRALPKLAVFAAIFAVLVLLPSAASASPPADYQGWGRVHSVTAAATAPAWQWTNGAWKASSRPAHARVYIYPYATGWAWTWDSATGWLAMQNSSLRTDQEVAIQLNGPRVFAHWHASAQHAVKGSNTVEMYRAEIRKAKAMGVDGFAYNVINVDTEMALVKMLFEAARAEGNFWLFPSADICCNMPDTAVDQVMMDHYDDPIRVRVNGGRYGNQIPLAQTWHGGGRGEAYWSGRQQVWKNSGKPMYFIPYFVPFSTPISTWVSNWSNDPATQADDVVDGFFNFSGFAKGTDTKAPVAKNREWHTATKAVPGLDAMYGCSPHFNRHSNVNPAENTYENRLMGDFEGFGTWIACLEGLVADNPRFIEIVTWNDYLEGSYVGGPYTKDQLWANYRGNHFSHDAFRAIGKYYFSWYTAGYKPIVTKDLLTIAHRPHPKCAPGVDAKADGSATCAAAENDTDLAEHRTGVTTVVRPLPRQFDYAVVEDKVYVAVILKAPGTVAVTSGSQTTHFDLPAGVSQVSVPMQIGSTQSVSLVRNGATVARAATDVPIEARPTLFNYNVATAHVEK